MSWIKNQSIEVLTFLVLILTFFTLVLGIENYNANKYYKLYQQTQEELTICEQYKELYKTRCDDLILISRIFRDSLQNR